MTYMIKFCLLLVAYQSVSLIALRTCKQSIRPSICNSFALYNTMTHGVKKENLPSKMCVTCNRPFTWRKKWERCWDEVTTCSKGCNAKRRALAKKDGRDVGDDHGDDGDEDEEVEDKKKAPDSEPFSPLKGKSFSDIAESVTKISGKDSKQTALGKEIIEERDEIDLDGDEDNDDEEPDAIRKPEKKLSRKKLQKLKMKETEGESPPKDGPTERTKVCAVCKGDMTHLFRCQWDASKQWRFVCKFLSFLFSFLCALFFVLFYCVLCLLFNSSSYVPTCSHILSSKVHRSYCATQ